MALSVLGWPALTAQVPAPLRGVAWMALAAASFAVMINVVRYLTETFDPLQVVFFRNLFGLLAMLPWLARHGLGVLRTQRIGLHVLRAAIGITAMMGWFTTLALMPLAEATALSFTAPLFTSVLAVIVLGEAMRLRRWTATMAGLAGALIILRPGFETVQPVALLAIATAAVWATSTVLIKVMARTESAGAIATYLVLFSTPLALIPALLVWVTPSLEQVGWCVLLGLAGSTGHVCTARALANADTTLVVPLDYIRLPAVALIAYLAFGEVADLWTWLGVAVIAASGIYITLREARVRRTAPAAEVMERAP
jgi:drug/metabolite transporter (DMT)-like permease